jgi:hypothetical protein
MQVPALKDAAFFFTFYVSDRVQKPALLLLTNPPIFLHFWPFLYFFADWFTSHAVTFLFYLNNFRNALPVAFPAALLATRLAIFLGLPLETA